MPSSFFSLMFLISALSLPVLAGPSGSGGGKGVVCRDSHKNVISVELLDLWEAQHIRDEKILHSNQDLARLTMDVIHGLKDAFDDRTHGIDNGGDQSHNVYGSVALETEMRLVAADFLKPHGAAHGIHRQHGISLNPTPDSAEILLPSEASGCQIEQLVTYLDSNPAANGEGEAFINEDLVSKMNLVNQAALYAHEAFYRVLRDWYGETNSVRTRRAIGFVFGGHIFTPVSSLIQPVSLDCRGEATQITINPQASGMFEIYPRILEGSPAMGQPVRNDQFGSLALKALVEGSDIYPRPITWPVYEPYPLRGLGPTDYDRALGTLIVLYESGHIEVSFSPQLLSQGSPVPIDRVSLHCKVVKR